VKPEVFMRWLVSQLRRLTYRWRPRTEARRRAKVAYGKYRCEVCKKTHAAKDTQLDHVIPVVDPEKGFTTWDDFIARLFVGDGGWQLLCHDCHKKKSDKENARRK